MQVLILFAVISFLTGCEKDNGGHDDFSRLKGTWINTESDSDALIFQNETLLERKNLVTGSINHHYSIKIESNEILLKYTGRDKIELENSKHRYVLNEINDTLVIENLDQYYPNYVGNKFYKSKNE